MPGGREEDDDGERESRPGAKEGALLFHTFKLLMCQDSLSLHSFTLWSSNVCVRCCYW
jgi:hypothetical protein